MEIKFRIPIPTNKEAKKDLSNFNSELNKISNNVLINENDLEYLTYSIKTKNELEKNKLLELISKKPYLGSL